MNILKKIRSSALAYLIATMTIFLAFQNCGQSGQVSVNDSPDAGVTDPPNTKLKFFAAGYSNDSNNLGASILWEDGVKAELPRLANEKFCEAKGIVVDGSNTYISGVCFDANNLLKVGMWKNGVWSSYTNTPVGGGYFNMNYKLVGASGNLYATGHQSFPGGTFGSGYYVNGAWVDLVSLSTSDNSYANTIQVIGSDIYVSGYNIDSSGVAIAGFWKNGVWVEMLKPNVLPYFIIGAGVELNNGTLYFIGNYQESYGKPTEAFLWTNSERSTLPILDSAKGCSAIDLVIQSNNIYILGNCQQGIEQIPGYWKNSVWTSLPKLLGGKPTVPAGIKISKKGNVLVCGYGTDASNVRHAVYWVDGTLNRFEVKDSSKDSGCRQITIVE